MKKLLVVIKMITVLMIHNIFSQTPPDFQTPPVHFEINSKFVEEANYLIEIMLPANYDSTQRYPIVYCVDNWLGANFVPALLYLLNFSQATDPFIVAGIGNHGTMDDWVKERTRDLTPYHLAEYDVSSSHEMGKSGVTGGANNFLLFIKNELIPFVENQYLADTLNRGFMGYSYGGLFGVYTLTLFPDLFQKYFFGSPSVWYNDYALIDSLCTFSPDNFSNIRGIYITVGENENGNQLKAFSDLRDCLQQKNIPTLNLTSHIIPGEDHRTAILSAYLKAFKCLYSKKL
jgi:predicted alpha/beta superfamily hydrolase